MRSELAQLIDSLASMLRNRTPASFADFENVLGQIATLDDPACINPLVLLLEDDGSLDELMFAIVHTIEVFDDDIYVDRIVRALPELVRKAPRWARLLHMRILNSVSTRKAYVERFQRAEPNEKAAAQEALANVCQWRPEFADHVNAITRMR